MLERESATRRHLKIQFAATTLLRLKEPRSAVKLKSVFICVHPWLN